ncbi:TonB-dependent receptor domain-containing protein [Novosphingobium profundi]|uniref:TonB-dependent receptor domain-containing protein n=1 Tax=Novosphingobium profundi TaxID=1774954 RepID=UPI001CFD1DE9|nr:TonB-dependent receptor [Novosphingobium profundi]
MKTHLKKAALISATSLTAAAALVSTNAYAQTGPAEASEPSGEIIVTGSRIARRNVESAAPVAVVDSEEFALSGAVNVESVINTLPQVVPGTTSFSNNPGGGVATLNLRGLGSARTMVLVNGRRWMFYDTQQIVDLNTIPSFLLESVDVVTGGASAVYGSDALAGVVNFRLKDVQGLEMGAQYGVTSRGDGQRLTANFAFGGEFADGRGHATVYGEYYDRKDVFASARKFSEDVNWDDYEGGIIPGGSSTTPQGRFTSTLAAADCPTGNVYCSPGAFYETPGSSRPRVGTDLYNYGPVNYLMVPQERYLMGGYADYEFSDGHTAYTEVSYVNNRVANELAATPVTGTFNIDIATASQFISAADVAAMNQLDTDGDGQVAMSVQRRTLEVGARNSLDERSAFRVLLGARGEITSNINYDAYYMFARTRNSNIQSGNVSRSAFQAGLDGSAPGINIYGPGTLTQAMADQIAITAQNTEISTLQVASGVISGSLFNTGMSRDDVGFAIGAEYRRVSSEFIPDTALSSGDVIGFNAGLPTQGAYDVKELFAELRVPLVTDTPGVYRLEATGAVRYSDYSLGAVGGVWAYAGGLEYAPIPDVTLRGQYQRAVRAPNVDELFGGQSQGFPGATDPCGANQAAAGQTDVVRQLCVASGVPNSAVWTDTIQLNTQIQGLFGGNADLQEETSDSWTAGAVFTPTFLPGFVATVDWYNIKVDGAISTLGGGLANSLNLCYNVIQDINSEYCQAFVGSRNALGQLDGENPPAILNANTGALEVEGIDFEVSYMTSIGKGLMGEDARISFNVLGNYTISNIYTPVADLPEETYECAGQFGTLVCGQPTPKWKWTSRLSLIDGPLTTSIRWRHVGAVSDDDPSTEYAVERLGSYDQFDLTLSADVSENFTLTAGVNNLFDKQPPIMGDNQQQTNTWPGVYDVLGRDFFISGRMTF